MEQVKSIISGIHIKYLRDYFSGIADHHSDDDYYGEQFHIQLRPQDNMVHGTIALPRTEIVFVGDLDVVEHQMHLYRMAFLSAGG
jgi:hypothetical protein